jgi:hypothetical protein
MKKPHLSSAVEDEHVTVNTFEKLETSEALVAYLNHIQLNLSFQVRLKTVRRYVYVLFLLYCRSYKYCRHH